jgi:hypothetical protein
MQTYITSLNKQMNFKNKENIYEKIKPLKLAFVEAKMVCKIKHCDVHTTHNENCKCV